MADPNYIRQQVKDVVSQRRVASRSLNPRPKRKLPPKDGGFLKAFLISCVMLMFFVILFFMLDKFKAEGLSTAAPANTPANTTKPVVDSKTKYDDFLYKEVKKLETNQKQIQANQKDIYHKVWKLVLGVNENAEISQKIDKRFHQIDNTGYISFDKDWKLSRIPSHIKLTDKQKQSLMK